MSAEMLEAARERVTTTTPAETRVLVVDDTPLDQKLLCAHLEPEGYEIHVASDGLEAWTLLERESSAFDVVLLDRSMPRMGGIELLVKIKSDARLRPTPVILQTALAGRDEVAEGIRAGAYYYLTKPYDAEMLRTVVATAARDFSEHKALRERVRCGANTLELLREARFTLQTLDQARDLGAVLASVTPDPLNAVIGLTELLVNAVEHGNLGITYEEKSQLNADGTWSEEVQRRLLLPENADKRVDVRYERDDAEIRFHIRDCGNGFDWERFYDVDPKRAFDNHGRGIAIARRLSFDAIEYCGNGNEVIGRVRLVR